MNKLKQQENRIEFLLVVLLSILFFLTPFFPDVQVIRPKLFVFEYGLFLIFLLYILSTIFLGKIQIKISVLYIPVLVYILYVLATYIFAENKFVAANELKRMILCSTVFLISLNTLKNDRDRLCIITSWTAGSLWSVLYGIGQSTGRLLILQVPTISGRVYSTFGNPIFFAAHLVLLLPVLLSLFLITKSFKFKILLSICFILTIYALYLTQTRAAFIAFSISILFFYILYEKKHNWKFSLFFVKNKIYIISFIILIIILHLTFFKTISSYNYFVNNIIKKINSIINRQQAHTLIWRDSLRMWLSNPIFGVGAGTFHINFPKFASKELLEIWPQKTRIINDAHNEYIQILAETGIFGLGIFLWILFTFFKYVFYKLKYMEEKQYIISAGLLSSCTAILSQNIFSVDMRFIFSSIYLFLAMGILCSYEEKIKTYRFCLSKNIKYTLLFILVLLSGIIGFGPGMKLHIAGIGHIDFENKKLYLKKSDEGSGLLPGIIKPYIAQQKLNSEPDFFDEKVLEPLKTISELNELLKKYPDEPRIYEKIAWVYAKEKNFPMAILNFKKAIELDPASFGAYNNLGNIYFLINQRDLAIESYKKSIEIKPDQIDAHVNLGIVYYYEGKLKESADEFEKVLKLDPKNEKAIVMLKRMRE